MTTVTIPSNVSDEFFFYGNATYTINGPSNDTDVVVIAGNGNDTYVSSGGYDTDCVFIFGNGNDTFTGGSHSTGNIFFFGNGNDTFNNLNLL